jgi:Fe-S oxidoreductase
MPTRPTPESGPAAAATPTVSPRPGPAVVDPAALALPLSPELAAAAELERACTRCGACAARCAFLQENGLPGEIAAALQAGRCDTDPFTCSLCNLCGAVCPEKLEPGAMFLAMRRQAVARRAVNLRPYRPLLTYEKLGNSRLLAWQGLPAGCRRVFFPGCALPGSRPESTLALYRRLRTEIPDLGIVLGCCAKPSHDLGRQQHFQRKFGEIRQRLLAAGVEEVLVACPNCHKVFSQYGGELKVISVWEVLAGEGRAKPAAADSAMAEKAAGQGEAAVLADSGGETKPAGPVVTVHDPCPLRGQPGLRRAVRRLLAREGLEVREMKASGGKTLCCGEGGAVGLVRPDLAANWGRMRYCQADKMAVVTYCAGCAGFLQRAGLAPIHLADLLRDPAAALAGQLPVAKSPWTYLNRLRLKITLIKIGVRHPFIVLRVCLICL